MSKAKDDIVWLKGIYITAMRVYTRTNLTDEELQSFNIIEDYVDCIDIIIEKKPDMMIIDCSKNYDDYLKRTYDYDKKLLLTKTEFDKVKGLMKNDSRRTSTSSNIELH